MSNENTARRGIYLPKELDEWLTEKAEKDSTKINTVIINALNAYKESTGASNRRKHDKFAKDVIKIIEQYKKDNNL